MKKSLAAALLLFTVACSDADSRNPVAPSAASPSVAALAGPANLVGARSATPFHILHPVLFPMQQGIVVFPPRNEPNQFFQNLQALYRDGLRRPQNAPTFVDPEGQNVWLTEYFRFYLNGCSHEDATSRTLQEIATGNTLPTCGGENLNFPPRNLPNEFQARLQATYRDVLGRPQTLSYVDSEGANVWLAQYLRFRITGGCNHATAESKVFAEVRGGGVQPDCGPPFFRSGMGNTVFDMPTSVSRVRIVGSFTGFCQNFIVRIGGRGTVNEILGTCSSASGTRYDAIHLTSGGVVEITSSNGVAWEFHQVQ